MQEKFKYLCNHIEFASKIKLITFRKPLKLFFWSSKMEISTEKKLKSHREKIGKSDFAPTPEKLPCYAPECNKPRQ